MHELRRFRFITDDEKKKDKFNELVDSKNLSREDLVLILTTITLNFDIFPREQLKKILGIRGSSSNSTVEENEVLFAIIPDDQTRTIVLCTMEGEQAAIKLTEKTAKILIAMLDRQIREWL